MSSREPIVPPPPLESGGVEAVYTWVIKDVVARVKGDFEAEGLGRAAMERLQSTWLSKLQESGALEPPPASEVAPLAQAKGRSKGRAAKPKAGAAGAAGALPALPPLDDEQLGAVGRPAASMAPVGGAAGSKRAAGEAAGAGPPAKRPAVPQLDGGAGAGGEDDLADVELSDDDLLVGDEDGGGAAGNLVLCQFDKVARTKNKWKCVLREGVMHLNGTEEVFQECTGDSSGDNGTPPGGSARGPQGKARARPAESCEAGAGSRVIHHRPPRRAPRGIAVPYSTR
eukprot:CAMPEP_0183792986 /NCGR_PEP_ID=MMETSP0803_2-20130417/2934_1 /TAXON_ID=195967 /ORGANISM="Crustomastix stigmata, Strain CCMP3273" /LENGTH=283 /DNA_ID=CAMNT_0026037359 /DNA_START=32 /DNA_END=880 /DNA_ORIENTATION=-